MVIDDLPTFREAARILLEARGYHVVAEAGCAASARDAVERHAPQAVLLDVRLGDDDGFAVCGELTRAFPELAVLLASSNECGLSDELIARCGARAGSWRSPGFPTSTSSDSGRGSESSRWASDSTGRHASRQQAGWPRCSRWASTATLGLVPDPSPPRQLLLYGFDAEANFEGRLVGALERMESGGALRIVEAAFIGRDAETGELAALDLRSRGAGSLVAPLIGFRLDPRERDRATKRALGADDGEMLSAVGAVLAPGAAIAAVLVEHTWARAFEDAVSQSGGTLLSGGFVEADTLSDLTSLLVDAASGR